MITNDGIKLKGISLLSNQNLLPKNGAFKSGASAPLLSALKPIGAQLDLWYHKPSLPQRILLTKQDTRWFYRLYYSADLPLPNTVFGLPVEILPNRNACLLRAYELLLQGVKAITCSSN